MDQGPAGPLDFRRSTADGGTMRRLILLRHAKSDWSVAGRPDRDRELTLRGNDAAAKIGAYMARHALVPDLVLCSTAARARQTWALVAEAFAAPAKVTYDDRLYEVSAKAILEVVRASSPDVHALAVVGHNPGLHDLAKLLIASGDNELRQRLLEKFPTAGLAVIDFPVDEWGKLHPQSGRLDRFVAPRSLEIATD
jgi:phosphohistidine phosphatase